MMTKASTCTDTFMTGAFGKGSAASESTGSNSCPIPRDQSGLEVIQATKNDRNGIAQISKDKQRQEECLKTTAANASEPKETSIIYRHDLRVPPT